MQQLQGLSSLAELTLYDNPITAAGLEHLQGLKSLRELMIDEPLLDSLGVEKLKHANPGLKVYSAN